MEFKRGKLVEFTEKYQWDYTLGDPELAKYGVVEQDTDGPLIIVRTSQGSRTINQNCIHAYAWAGWFPEELETILEELNPFDGDCWDDCDEYI